MVVPMGPVHPNSWCWFPCKPQLLEPWDRAGLSPVLFKHVQCLWFRVILKKKPPKLSRNFPWMCPLLAPRVPAVLLCCHRPHRAHEGMDGAGESPGRICTKGSGAWMWPWHGEDTEPGLSPGCQGAPPRPRSNTRGAAGGKGRGWEMAREDEQVGNKWGRLRSCVQGGFGAW